MSFKPEYQVLYEELTMHIRNGEQAPGSMLPPERKLMDNFKLSRTTVRRALDMLVADGMIERRAGIGAIVKNIPVPGSSGRKLRIGIDFAGASDQAYLSLLSEELMRFSRQGRIELVAKSYAELIAGDGLDGAIFFRLEHSAVAAFEHDFCHGCPTVCINRTPLHPDVAYFTVDYRETACRIVNRLFINGARRVAMIGGGVNADNSRYADYLRTLGWQDACRKNMAAVPAELFIETEAMYRDFPRLCTLLRDGKPEVLFVSIASLIPILCVALKQLDIVPGRELDIICFDNVERLADSIGIAMSYVKMPFRAMIDGAIGYIASPAGTPAPKELVKAQMVVDNCRYLL